MFSDYEFAVAHDVEQLIWKSVHYRPIEEFRSRLRIADQAVQQQQLQQQLQQQGRGRGANGVGADVDLSSGAGLQSDLNSNSKGLDLGFGSSVASLNPDALTQQQKLLAAYVKFLQVQKVWGKSVRCEGSLTKVPCFTTSLKPKTLKPVTSPGEHALLQADSVEAAVGVWECGS